MQTWIALLRGINVGGHHKMPMAELVSTLELAGCTSVRTYIQSGNVVFKCDGASHRELSERLGNAIEDHFKFRPTILLLKEVEFRSAVSNNPFLHAISEPKTLHFYFLESKPNASAIDSLATLATPSEHYRLIDRVLYLHAPDGIGRSKLASIAERKLGVPATARNYNTIQALSTMLDV